jgi:hypothetical protein
MARVDLVGPLLLLMIASRMEAQGGRASSPKFTPPDTMSTVRGTVTDSVGHALDSVEVYVMTSGQSVRTDAGGRYVLNNLLSGPTRLRARRVGWRPVDTAFVLVRHGSAEMNLMLGGRVTSLDTIRVRTSQDDCAPRKFAGFTCRRQAGIGVFRDSAELAALHPEYIADLFDGMPGLRRDGRGVQATTRWTCLYYLVDGHPPMSVERLMYGRPPWVKDVVAVEFYENANTAPAWYKNFTWVERAHLTTPCSLIVYWTRGTK